MHSVAGEKEPSRLAFEPRVPSGEKPTMLDDPRKRPLLTPKQLRLMSREVPKPKKGTPREEFEKLFRKPPVPSLN
jgi:hypothetical protein